MRPIGWIKVNKTEGAQIYFTCPRGNMDDLAELSTLWSDCKNLNLNSNRTKAILILPVSCDSISLLSVKMLDEDIGFVGAISNLGFRLNSRLGAVDHVNFTIMRSFRFLFLFFMLLSSQNWDWSYAAKVYGNLDYVCSNKLEGLISNYPIYMFLINVNMKE